MTTIGPPDPAAHWRAAFSSRPAMWRAVGERDARLATLVEDLRRATEGADTVRVVPQVRGPLLSCEEWSATCERNGPSLLSGWVVLVIHRFGRSTGRPPFAAAYWHTDYWSAMSRLEKPGWRVPLLRGDVGFVPFDAFGCLCPA